LHLLLHEIANANILLNVMLQIAVSSPASSF
jgi:hypothetical protein